MIIAVSASGPSMDDQVDARFGRCRFFLIINTDTMDFEAMENPNMSLGGGAGIQSAQMMAERGVVTVLTGNCGPNAFRVFESAGISVVTGASGTVRQAVEQFNAGGLASSSGANVNDHFGMGGGMGSGRGMGGGMGSGRGMGGGMGSGRGMGGGMGSGRGMGGGMGSGRGMGGGMGQGTGPVNQAPPSQLNNQGNEIDQLRDQARALSDQLKQIEERINSLQDKDKS